MKLIANIRKTKKILEAVPERSTIVLRDKCSDCGCKIIIDITPSSGGHGLHRGAFLECSTDEYCTKCAGCCKVNQKKYWNEDGIKDSRFKLKLTECDRSHLQQLIRMSAT